jgi:hypothetical protein
MNTTVSELSRAGNELATRERAAGIVKAGLAAPLACRPVATVRAGALSPGFERIQLAIAARERRRISREQEATAARERRRIAREQRAAEKARLREIRSTSYHIE